MPMALPVLPVDDYVVYAQRLGVAPGTEEKKELYETLLSFAKTDITVSFQHILCDKEA